MAKKLLLGCLLLVLSMGQTGYWDYYDEGNLWGGFCSLGVLQSPINFETTELITIPKNSDISMEFNLKFKSSEITAYQNASTIYYTGDLGYVEAHQKDDKKNKHQLTVTSVLFHAPGEHQVNGMGSDLEVQIFMQNQTSGNTVALAVMLEATSTTKSKYITNVIKSLSSPVKFSTSQLFGSKRKLENFYHYRGSLTFPGCFEVVDWYVWSTVQQFADDQNAFFNMMWQGNNSFAGGNGNNRAIQPSNTQIRYILQYMGDDSDSAALLSFALAFFLLN